MAASSSSTVDELPPKHQVFINYRGRDLRFGFVSHLSTALKHHNINVFIDNHEDKGQRLDFLLEKIMESTIALCIFSTNYTESVLCLTELTIIKKFLERGKLVVIPVFYKLEPSTVRHMRGEFGDAFRFKNLTKSDERKKKKWKEAVKSISQLIGITVHERSYEASAINEIVYNVQKVIRTTTNSPLDGKVHPQQIQVFINFRGAQLRNNFIGYLVDALKKSEVNVFADNYLLIGDDLNQLFKKIEDSGIAVVVFSSRYTESKWCLEELVKIKERVSQGMLKVIPVFYKVTPTNVKRLKGEFGDNFRDREWEFESDEPKIKRWKEAIKFISHKFSLTFDEKSALEIDFVGNVVTEVLKTLETISTRGNTLQLSFV